MSVLKNATTPNGAILGYHRAIVATADLTTGVVLVQVVSHVDEAAYIAKKPHAWTWNLALPVVTLDMTSIENILVTSNLSPFEGGTITPDAADSLDAVKTRKMASLNEACTRQITQGFHSNALGTDRLYPAKPLDQTNLIASVVDSLMPGNTSIYSTPFWCANAGVWAYEMHNASQVQQVGRDGKASIVAALFKNNGLAGQVGAATTADQVAAVVWQ